MCRTYSSGVLVYAFHTGEFSARRQESGFGMNYGRIYGYYPHWPKFVGLPTAPLRNMTTDSRVSCLCLLHVFLVPIVCILCVFCICLCVCLFFEASRQMLASAELPRQTPAPKKTFAVTEEAMVTNSTAPTERDCPPPPESCL